MQELRQEDGVYTLVPHKIQLMMLVNDIKVISKMFVQEQKCCLMDSWLGCVSN